MVILSLAGTACDVRARTSRVSPTTVVAEWLDVEGRVTVALRRVPLRRGRPASHVREEDPVAWFRRRSAATAAAARRQRDDFAHLEQFVATRRGVEAFLEPKTTVTETTVMLIAHDGEWTRRRVPERRGGPRLGQPGRHPRLRRGPGRLPASGCATTTSAASRPKPDRRRGQPLAAMSSISSSSRRTGTPVPPLAQ